MSLVIRHNIEDNQSLHVKEDHGNSQVKFTCKRKTKVYQGHQLKKNLTFLPTGLSMPNLCRPAFFDKTLVPHILL